MLFLSIPFRNLGRRPWRSLFTALGVGVAVATFIALVGTTRGLEHSWTQSMVERHIHMVAYRKGAVEILGSAIDQAAVDRISRVPGVKLAAGELVDLVHMPEGVILTTSWPAGSFLWHTIRLRQGRLPGPSDTHGVVMGQRLAERLNLGPGQTFSFLGEELQVLGVSHQTSALNESALVLLLPLAQRLTAKEGKVTIINLRFHHPEDSRQVEEIKSRLARLFPDLVFLETREVTDANQIIRLFRRLNWSISLIAMIMGFFFILNTLLMSVTERTREFGILSAVGWGRARILTMVMWEGFFLAALGSMVGLVVGLASLHFLASLKNLQGIIDPVMSARLLLEVLAAATLLGILSSLYPAWRTTRLIAVEALKYE